MQTMPNWATCVRAMGRAARSARWFRLLQASAWQPARAHSTRGARRAVAPLVPFAQRYPTAFAQWLNAAVYSLADPIEIAVSGDPLAADSRALLAVARDGFRPFAVLAAGQSDGAQVPLLLDRPQREGRATAYVCRHFACSAPITDPDALRPVLESGPEAQP